MTPDYEERIRRDERKRQSNWPMATVLIVAMVTATICFLGLLGVLQ